MRIKELKELNKYEAVIFTKTSSHDFKDHSRVDLLTLRGGIHPFLTIIKNVTITNAKGEVYKECFLVFNNKKLKFKELMLRYSQYKNLHYLYYFPKDAKICQKINSITKDVVNSYQLNFISQTSSKLEKKSFLKNKEVKNNCEFDAEHRNNRNKSIDIDLTDSDYVGHISFAALGCAVNGDFGLREVRNI